MHLFHKTQDYRQWCIDQKANGKSIGFVPTMGALHSGHLSLFSASNVDNDLTVCSIYVNPTQFNEESDFEQYPRILDADIAALGNVSCDVLFAPDSSEMYPDEKSKHPNESLNLGTLIHVMEGEHRPGHFNGVVTIVERLFEIINPDRAYFGQKDYQQLAVVRSMNAQLDLPIEIIGCPTVREEDGLAMSSRNLLLSSVQRSEAPAIYQALSKGKDAVKELGVEQLKAMVQKGINDQPHLEVEYVEVSDSHSLEPISTWSGADSAVCCVAAYAGKVRLIDNIILYN